MHKLNPSAWLKTKRGRRGTAVAATAAVGALLLIGGAASTSSLFSDTHSGVISGGIGNVHITTSGGTGADSTNLSFGNNMQPGVPQTVTETYQNVGSGDEDVWLTFPNETALSALNSLGSYGEVHITANGNAVFDSANLKDTAASCGAFSPSGCWPLLKQYKLGTIKPGHKGSFSFTFNYAAKLSTNPPAGSSIAWNGYPIPQGLWSRTNTQGQTYINASDGTGTGLPYALVATQVGQSPA
jgi:hypothetical protein